MLGELGDPQTTRRLACQPCLEGFDVAPAVTPAPLRGERHPHGRLHQRLDDRPLQAPDGIGHPPSTLPRPEPLEPHDPRAAVGCTRQELHKPSDPLGVPGPDRGMARNGTFAAAGGQGWRRGGMEE